VTDVRLAAESGPLTAPRDESGEIVATPRARAPRVAALGLSAVALAAVAGSLVVTAPGVGLGPGLVGGIVVAFVAAGLFAFARKPAEQLGPVVLLVAALAGLAMLARALTRVGTAGGIPSWLVASARLVGLLAEGLVPMAAMQLLLGLPDGTCRLKRRVLAGGYLAGALVGLVIWLRRPTLGLWPIWTETVLVLAVGIIGSSRRYTLAHGLERRRMQWFGWAAVVECGLLVLAVGTRFLWGWPTDVSLVLAVSLTPYALAVAICSSRRYEERVEALLSPTVAVVSVLAVAVLVTLVVFVGYGPALDGRDHLVLGLAVLASVVVAIAARPVRSVTSRLAASLTSGERREASEVLHTFGTRLSRAVPMDELLLHAAETLQATLGLERAEIWTGSDGRLERTVAIPSAGPATIILSPEEESVVARAGVSGRAWLEVWLPSLVAGDDTAPVRVAPATHSGRVLGLIVVGRRPGGESFGVEDDAMLSELARQVGLALQNVALDSALQASLDEVRRQAEELQASRARIVAASDAARRQIERNLHDGAQQHLVALAVNLRLARRLANTDPAASAELLDQLGEGLNDAVQELRALAHGIYPPLLVDRGLEEALRSAAGRSPIPTDVEAAGLGRYSAEEEAAVYFCCMEALQNAGKHAGEGATAAIRVWEESGGLLFEVSDTGVGFDTGAFRRRGAGFVNMSDRVGAIGGTVQVWSAPGRGTTVSGRLPISR